MQSSAELFELVKSLGKQEKRYFRLESMRQVSKEENQYLTLFDALDSMQEYDEKTLRRKLQGESFLSRLSAVKNYLYDAILTTMASYHAGVNVARELDEQMRKIHVLYRKSLYMQCRKQILKAKEIAKNYEAFTRLLDLLELEKNIHALLRFSEATGEIMNDILAQENEILEKIRNTRYYYNKNARLIMLLHQKGLRISDETREAIEEIMDEGMYDENRALTFDARLYFYTTHAAYGQATGNLEHAHRYTRSYVEFLDARPHRYKDNANRVVVGLSNFMISCAAMKGKQEDILRTLEKLARIQTHKDFQAADIQLKIFLARYVNESLYCIEMCEFEKAGEIAVAIENGLERFGDKINRNERLMLCSYLAYLFFGHADYSNALKWNNKILHHFEPNIREDIQSYSRLLNLLIHIEKGNEDLLEYEVKSASRFLAKQKRKFNFENLMLDFIRKTFLRGLSKKEITLCFIELKKEIENIFTDPQEKRVEEFFDFESWVNSKIEGRPFAEIRKRRLN